MPCPCNAPPRRQRGVSLVEAMVAFVIAGFGMLAMVGVQTTLRTNADVAKQRTEALRLGQRYMEALRGFPTLADYGALGTATELDWWTGHPTLAGDITVGNATYRVSNEAVQLPNLSLTQLQVKVDWSDRLSPAAGSSSVLLSTLIAGIDPSLSGWLTAPLPPVSRVRPYGRHASIPLSAVDFGDGRSYFRPPGAESSLVWVFNNKTGVVTACSVAPSDGAAALTAADVLSCSRPGFLVSGYVLFSLGDSVSAADAERPSSLAMDLAMTVVPDTGKGSSGGCYDNAPTALSTFTDVAYYCLVYGAADTGTWSGPLDVAGVGWTPGTAADAYRVCRYSADYDANRTVANDEHPAAYVNVSANLVQQNFLVVRGPVACPTDVAASPTTGDAVNSNTVEQAPTATATPVAATPTPSPPAASGPSTGTPAASS